MRLWKREKEGLEEGEIRRVFKGIRLGPGAQVSRAGAVPGAKEIDAPVYAPLHRYSLPFQAAFPVTVQAIHEHGINLLCFEGVLWKAPVDVVKNCLATISSRNL